MWLRFMGGNPSIFERYCEDILLATELKNILFLGKVFQHVVPSYQTPGLLVPCI